MLKKPYQRNKYLVCVPRKIFGTILKWTREELKQIDRSSRKLMTMHKTLHPRDDDHRQFVSRKKRGRGLSSMEDNVDASIQFECYIEKHREELLQPHTDNTKNNNN